MDSLAERSALAALVVAGAATALPPALVLTGIAWTNPFAISLMHSQVLVALLGMALVAAAFMPRLRLPVIGAAALSKAAFFAVALAAPASRQGPSLFLSVHAEIFAVAALVAAGTYFWRMAVRETRWDAMVPLRRGY